MQPTPAWVDECRRQFPALHRPCPHRPAVFLDGPAGTQVPQTVITAVSAYLSECNANHGGLFATSRDSDARLQAAHAAVADLLGTDDADTVAFGPNMTSLTLALSRALARTWNPGDEIIVTRLEHDANFTPWVLAARDAGVVVRYAEIHRPDCTLDLDQLHSQLNRRTRLIAVGCASNAAGTVNPVRQICDWAARVGCPDFSGCGALGTPCAAGRARLGLRLSGVQRLQILRASRGDSLGPACAFTATDAVQTAAGADDLPGRWMTGTQNHEGIAGTLAAVEYLADLGRRVAQASPATRRQALEVAFRAIRAYETQLARQLLDGLEQIPLLQIWGITDRDRLDERVPTVSFTHARRRPAEIAAALGHRGVFVWHGNNYALPLTEALGLEPDGMVRVGAVHYNTPEDIDSFLSALREEVTP